MSAHGIRFLGNRFWVIHRRRSYGPFDYEWSHDFCGIEFHYRGNKFGEYCSSEEMYADLKPFHLPASVFKVASISIGTVVQCMLNGMREDERDDILSNRLNELGFKHFAQIQ